MVRTKADCAGRKAVAAKAPRKFLNSGESSSSGDSRNHPGAPLVNHAKLWPTPKWQKGIGNFFTKKQTNGEEGSSSAGASTGTTNEQLGNSTNERLESSEVLVQNTPSLEVAEDTERQETNDTIVIPESIDIAETDENKSPESGSKRKSSGKGKEIVRRNKPSGKSKMAKKPHSNKKKRTLGNFEENFSDSEEEVIR